MPVRLCSGVISVTASGVADSLRLTRPGSEPAARVPGPQLSGRIRRARGVHRECGRDDKPIPGRSNALIKVESSVMIDRPVQEVFAFVTDPSNKAKRQEGLIESRLESPGPVGQGEPGGFF